MTTSKTGKVETSFSKCELLCSTTFNHNKFLIPFTESLGQKLVLLLHAILVKRRYTYLCYFGTNYPEAQATARNNNKRSENSFERPKSRIRRAFSHSVRTSNNAMFTAILV